VKLIISVTLPDIHQVADPDKAFVGGSQIGDAIKSELFKYPRLPATIVEYHTKVVTFGLGYLLKCMWFKRNYLTQSLKTMVRGQIRPMKTSGQ